MRNYENPTKCPRCNEPVSFEKQIGANNGPNCPHCGHRIYCVFCGHPQIEIKNDKWACPFIDGSPMHFGLHCPTDDEENERWLRENRFGTAGFTLDEYRDIVTAWNKPRVIQNLQDKIRRLQGSANE